MLIQTAAVEAFDDLFKRSAARVHTYLLRSLNAADVDDVLVDTFATLWLRWNDLPVDEPERTAWVLGVARNKLREHQRSRDRQDAVVGRVAALAGRPSGDPAEVVTALDRTRALLGQLPDDEADAITLTVLAGLTPAQAGIVLGCPRSTVNTRTQRGREHLRLLIAREVSDDA